MTIKNAIAKLERAGWAISKDGGNYLATKSGRPYTISFVASNGYGTTGPDVDATHAQCLRVTHVNDKDDFQSDYFAGHYMDTMAHALRFAERS